MEVIAKRVYRHYGGDLYLVEAIGYDCETLEKMVIYRALYEEGKVWVRTYEDFIKEVNKNGQKHRFELQNIESVKINYKKQ